MLVSSLPLFYFFSFANVDLSGPSFSAGVRDNDQIYTIGNKTIENMKIKEIVMELKNQKKPYKIGFMSAIPAVQSLSISYNSDTLLVGTRGGDIIELNIKDGGLVRETPLVTGHHYGELWGLAYEIKQIRISFTCPE